MKHIVAISIIFFTFQIHAQTKIGGSLETTGDGGNFVLQYLGEYKNPTVADTTVADTTVVDTRKRFVGTGFDIRAAYGMNFPLTEDDDSKIDRIDVSIEHIFNKPAFLGIDLRTEFERVLSPTMRVRAGAAAAYYDITLRGGVAVEWLAEDDYERGIGLDVAIEFYRKYEINGKNNNITARNKVQVFIAEKKSIRSYNEIALMLVNGIEFSVDGNLFINQYTSEVRKVCQCADQNAFDTTTDWEVLFTTSFNFGS